MGTAILAAKLNDREFQTTMRKLAKQPLSFGGAFKLKSIIKKLDSAKDTAATLYMDIIKKHVELDENGNIKPDAYKEDVTTPDGEVVAKAGSPIRNSYIVKEGCEQKLAEEVGSFMSTPLPLDGVPKLKYEELQNVELSAMDLDMLEEILDIPEDILNNVIS
jgi:hypothetical protein